MIYKTAHNQHMPGISGASGKSGSNWLRSLGNIDWKTAGKVGLGLGAAGGLLGYASSGIDFDPTLTEESVREAIDQHRSIGGRAISRRSTFGKTDAASQFYARGLGSSGAVIGDIAGYDQAAMDEIAQLEAALSEELMKALQYIDQRDLQLAMAEAEQDQGIFSTIGELSALGMFLI